MFMVNGFKSFKSFIEFMDLAIDKNTLCVVLRFYRAMHFSAKRGIAIACRLSVRLSVCL